VPPEKPEMKLKPEHGIASISGPGDARKPTPTTTRSDQLADAQIKFFTS
jgi:hypothetical protein